MLDGLRCGRDFNDLIGRQNDAYRFGFFFN